MKNVSFGYPIAPSANPVDPIQQAYLMGMLAAKQQQQPQSSGEVPAKADWMNDLYKKVEDQVPMGIYALASEALSRSIRNRLGIP